jgi:hypothetical protein
MMERAKPQVLRGFAQQGVAGRLTMLTGEHRSKIARKAARARCSKLPGEHRTQIAKKAAGDIEVAR